MKTGYWRVKKNYTPVVQEEMNEATNLILFPCWKVTCCEKKKTKQNCDEVMEVVFGATYRRGDEPPPSTARRPAAGGL